MIRVAFQSKDGREAKRSEIRTRRTQCAPVLDTRNLRDAPATIQCKTGIRSGTAGALTPHASLSAGAAFNELRGGGVVVRDRSPVVGGRVGFDVDLHINRFFLGWSFRYEGLAHTQGAVRASHFLSWNLIPVFQMGASMTARQITSSGNPLTFSRIRRQREVMGRRAPVVALLVCGFLTLGGQDCESSDGGEMATGGTGGDMGTGGTAGDVGTGGTAGGTGAEDCGGDTECTFDSPSHCGTLCQGICGGFEFFWSAGCGPDDRCFCVCTEEAGVCTEDPL